mgnify:CR=1 FL=1
MELVDGKRIDQHAHAARLSVEQRLRLFAHVIDEVQCAHARLLIHRDIKPSNVLIDADGRAKLLDFCIAELIDDADAARAYSPGWASPEQRAGEHVGPASDQYQLGLLLDATLRDAADRDAAATQTEPRTHHPNRVIDVQRWPSMASSRRADLYAILRKATEPWPSARYGSVSELGNDRAQWLAHQPVTARGAGLGYTFACALRRHPFVATVGCICPTPVCIVASSGAKRILHSRSNPSSRTTTRGLRASACVLFVTTGKDAFRSINMRLVAGSSGVGAENGKISDSHHVAGIGTELAGGQIEAANGARFAGK